MSVVTILSSFPPDRCGIGYYAEQQARSLEAEGHRVFRVDSHVLNRAGWRGGSLDDLRKKLILSDKIVVHFQGSLLYCRSGVPGFKSITPFIALNRVLDESLVEVEIVVHENYSPYPRGLNWTPLGWVQESIVSSLFKKAKTVLFHTSGEAKTSRIDVGDRAQILDPAKFYKPNVRLTKEEARAKLGLGAEKVFFCAGFYHPGKGFERLVAAFKQVPAGKLFVFTTDRERKWRDEMVNLVSQKVGERTTLTVGRFLSDEEYDTWLIACDFVVVPYTYGFTSGLMGRASVFDKPCIVSALPGLVEQASPRDFIFSTDDELRTVLETLSC